MKNKTLFNEIRRALIYTLCAFFVLGAAYSSVMVILHVNSAKAQSEIVINEKEALVKIEKSVILNKIGRLVSDLLYIYDSYTINNKANTGYAELETQWLAFSNRKKIYDQIRFIDADGNEVIRVNYAEGGSYLTPTEKLQNKSDRYYFTNTMALSKNQIYISKLDLNMENGKIEQPLKPVLRLSLPFYDENGIVKGIIILNYAANDILEQVKAIATASYSNIFMLNPDGYWLADNVDPDREWAFMYADRLNESFLTRYPDEWKRMIDSHDGFFVTSDGMFSYESISLNDAYLSDATGYALVLDESDFVLVNYLSPESKDWKAFTESIFDIIMIVFREYAYLYLYLFLIAAAFGTVLLLKKNETEKIVYLSEYDVMTGVYNRRAGFEKLAQLYKQTAKKTAARGKNICICFIDINGLKEVNDRLGHDVGDELIVSVIAGIRKNIRGNDFIARLGGDEFLVVFPEATQQEAEGIWTRINAEFTQINERENRKYVISASHGIEEFNLTTNKYIDAVINAADEKMYREKRLIKKELKVVRDW